MIARTRRWYGLVVRPQASSAARRLHLDGGRAELLALVAMVGLIAAGVTVIGATTVPTSSFVVPIAAGVLVLRLAQIRVLVALTAVAMIATNLVVGFTTARLIVFLVVAAVAAISYYTVHARERLGLVGTRGDAMLGELRERLLAAPNVAALPDSWRLELAARTAGGSKFGGDFVVSCATGSIWELVLVDVSGKGADAGTRALQLSGALGGLIGSVPSSDFLEKSNDYVLRQNWSEAFATAVHLRLDVDTGKYAIRSAGHPPAASFRASNGEWTLADAQGPALGFLPEVAYLPTTGWLERGDALLLYTDGLVEIPGRDLALGIDKLVGAASTLVVHGFTGGANRLIDAVAPGGTDDRAVLLIWRP